MSSPEALYHAVPQAPVANLPITISNTSLDGYDDDRDDNGTYIAPAESPYVEAKIRWIHFILGCAVLLPWNVMITANPYFINRLSGSSLGSSFSSYLSTTLTIANFGFLAHATMRSKDTSPSRQIRLTTLSLSVLTLLLTLSTFLHLPPGLFFAFVIADGMAQSAFGSYLQTSVIAVASLFGPAALQSVMSGQAAVAVAVSGVQVVSSFISVLSHNDDGTTLLRKTDEATARAAFAFFALSTIFLLVAAAANAYLTNMPAYKIVVQSLERSHGLDGDGDETRCLVSGERGQKADKSQIIRVAKANFIYELAVALVFLVTLSVFPAITISVRSVRQAGHPLLFSAIHFLMFNIGDFTGRNICTIPRLVIWSGNTLFSLSAARVLFVPLFLMCNIQGSVQTPVISIIKSDALFMLILFAFGMSNGYLSSLCMMAAPSLEHNPRLRGRKEDVDVAATVASFCLVAGLSIGGFASFAVRASICKCNPFVS